MLPYTILLWLDKKAGVEGKKKAEEEEGEGTRRSSLRLLRLLSGGLAVLAGLVTVFVLGMIFRPLATSGLAGAITGGSFFASALARGRGLTGMWLWRWCIATPPLSAETLQCRT